MIDSRSKIKIGRALKEGKRVTLNFEWGVISTHPAGASWNADWIIRVQAFQGCSQTSKYVYTLEEVETYLSHLSVGG